MAAKVFDLWGCVSMMHCNGKCLLHFSYIHSSSYIAEEEQEEEEEGWKMILGPTVINCIAFMHKGEYRMKG